tara:strand:+ start:1209 stop:1814 length:606 start_codon:yes stop_codon:yes gene_type:complete
MFYYFHVINNYMRKILIIGSSYIIKKTFKKKFSKDDITFTEFRKIWEQKNIEKFDIIILSGFHRKILHKKISYIEGYILKYDNFINFLTKNCDQLYLISTFIPNYYSFSRIVFFYKSLILKSMLNHKVKVISFRKIIDEKFKNKLFFKILKLLKFNLTDQEYLINNTEKFILKDVPITKILLLGIPRLMLIERIIRLLDID